MLAVDVLSRYDGPWAIGFQHDNAQAGAFWREIADVAFGPGRPDVPPDHFIEFI